MAHLVLARKLRPSKFEDVAGQSAIVLALKNSIKEKKTGHAYLFSGTRGIGKTTIARIFAKSLRCLSPVDGSACLKCQSCISSEGSVDIVEIDGASNNTVDDVRELIANCHYLPTVGNYKIYIIDEVHMLSVSAFNALLKTLEEPPAHVIFILATTIPEKLPETVLSRCQHFAFRSASSFDLVAYLNHIQKTERLRFEAEELKTQIAEAANGSYRDLLTILEQLSALSDTEGMITESSMVSVLGISSRATIEKSARAILSGNEAALKDIFLYINERNIDLKKFSEQLLTFLFNIVMDKKLATFQVGLAEAIWIHEELARDFTWALNSPTPRETIFICMLKVLHRKSFLKNIISGHAESAELAGKQTIAEPVPPKKEFVYRELVEFIRPKNQTLAANLEHAFVVSADEGNFFSLTLGFEQKNKVLMDFVSDVAIKAKIIDFIKEFHLVEAVTLEIILKEPDQGLSSLHDELVKELEDQNQQRQKEFLEDPLIKKMENMFNSKVDKVILNNRQ